MVAVWGTIETEGVEQGSMLTQLPGSTSVGNGAVVGGEATVTFGHGSNTVEPNIVVEWDFDNDGDFSEPEEDITNYFSTVETMSGRDFPSQLSGKAGPGKLSLTLVNEDDRFSYFNADSPLNQGANSLRVGRKIRIRDADAVVADPVLLVRDRFNRGNGDLNFTETGQLWDYSSSSAAFGIRARRVVAQTPGGVIELAFVDTGQADGYYVQGSIEQVATFQDSFAGLVARRTDDANYAFVRLTSTNHHVTYSSEIELGEVVAGIETVLGIYDVTGWPGLTIGLKSGPDDVLTAYAGGVPVMSAATTLGADSTAGIFYRWSTPNYFQEPPILDNFYVYSGVVEEVEGVLWTGSVSQVQPSVQQGVLKTVTVTADGALFRAALPDVAAPRAGDGAKTGVLVGDVLARGGLLHPPGTLDEGTIKTGPVGIADGKALEMARRFEETERGFLYEMNEGAIAYEDRETRESATVQAVFSDAPGAQFGYAELSPLDQRRDIVNRVTAGIAPEMPAGVTTIIRSNATSPGTQNNVAVQMPATVNPGDLLAVFIVSSVGSASVDWLTPIWWGNRRQGLKGDIRTRVYTRHCDGTEAGQTYTFYIDSTSSGGNWLANIYRIESWFLSTKVGITDQIEFVEGHDPAALDHGWGRVPTLFIAVDAGLTSVSGGSLKPLGELKIPDGYAQVVGNLFGGGVPGTDVALITASRFHVAEADDPTNFDLFEGFAINESAVFAVRGFNGPHAVLPTLQNPNQFEATPGRFVTVEDVDSQDDLQTIRSHEDASNLFATEADATDYAQDILETFSDDRPIFSLTFNADQTAAYRNQAIRRRVGHKIHLVANNAAGLGVDADFFIESVGHRIRKNKTHETTWELSPA